MKSSNSELLISLIADCGEMCGVATERDIKTVMNRIEHEGDSFSMITLPTFAKDFERCLDVGHVDSKAFLSFKKRFGLPAFLHGFLSQVFDVNGRVLDSPSTSAIRCIRQICLFQKKIFEVTDQRRIDKELRNFVQLETEMSESQVVVSDSLKISFRFLFQDALNRVEDDVSRFLLSPKHGPGATSDKLRGNAKFVQVEWPERLESVFPYGEYVLPSWRYYLEHAPITLDENSERPVKVTPVPKTRSKPRLIAIEPTAMQYAQQGLLQSLVRNLESGSNCHDMIGFTNQVPNQDLAREGSITGRLATLDLSEASDRVRYDVVMTLLAPWPHLRDALDASRSRSAELPSGQRISLCKFASMGSAVCFPVEAMVFLAICFNAVARRFRNRSTALNVVRSSIRVYGDDIIVPVEDTLEVIADLEALGLKVNHSKSFWTGRFRESCGGDYYAGESVKPVYQRVDVGDASRNARFVSSLVSTGNQLADSGYSRTADECRRIVESITGPLPSLPDDSQGLGWHFLYPEFLEGTKIRWNTNLQRYEVKTYVVSGDAHRFEIDGPWALRKCLSDDWSDPADEGHLLAYGRSSCVRMNKRWIDASDLV